MAKPTVLKITAAVAAAWSDDGASCSVTAKTAGGTVEIVATPEIGQKLARLQREAASYAWVRQIELGQRQKDDEGPNEPVLAQSAAVVLDPDNPERVGIYALGTPMPPVIVIPTRQLPALIATAHQVIEDIAAAAASGQGVQLGTRADVPMDAVRPATLELGVAQDGEEILLTAIGPAGDRQALLLQVDGIDELIEMLQSAKADALHRRGGSGNGPPRLN